MLRRAALFSTAAIMWRSHRGDLLPSYAADRQPIDQCHNQRINCVMTNKLIISQRVERNRRLLGRDGLLTLISDLYKRCQLGSKCTRAIGYVMTIRRVADFFKV